ncbi:heterokaryon incompatibility protein-domain-containing protein [Xylaria telfairii]|nr:heterokaryon incompatibility protein-domain-containing protein [Xylaria telfairii]
MAWWSACQKFKYPSLSSKPRSFRVIKLSSPSRSFFPPFREILNIELDEIDVDDAAGEYDTLSYCWGTGAPNKTVLVWLLNDKTKNRECRTLRISASLESALLHLARDTKVEASRPIFADQICINQADDIEKIQQVRLMGEVYSRSARTVVWLGEDTSETRRYFEFSSNINSEGILSRVAGPNRAHYINVFDAIMDPSMELQTEAEKEDRTDVLDLLIRYGPIFPVRGLTEVLRRAWVNRLWTVQEGCLPANVILRCGQQSLCYECVRGTLLFHSVWASYWLRVPKKPVAKEEFRAINAIYTLSQSFLRLIRERRVIHGTQEQRRSLYDTVVLYNVNDHKPKIGASKAEDRIYALLGLADNDEIARETVDQMEIGNVRGTFTKFAASVVTRNVDVLLFSQLPKSPAHGHQLPSWVPDWSNDPLRTPYGYSDLTTPVFSAGGRRDDVEVIPEASTGVLWVNAIPVGRVVRVGMRGIQHDETATIENVEFMSVRRFFEEAEEFMKAAAEINLTNAPDISDDQRRIQSGVRLSDGGLSIRQLSAKLDTATADALLRNVYIKASQWGKQLIDVEAQNRPMSIFTSMVHRKGFFLKVLDVGRAIYHIVKVRLLIAFLSFRRKRAKVDLYNLDQDTNLKKVGLTQELLLSQEWELYTSNLFKSIGRKLFLTDTGYVGLGPCHTREDDAIVVIPGSSMPHILRPQVSSNLQNCGLSNENASWWSYVGEAYCDGIMDGELVSRDCNAATGFNIV